VKQSLVNISHASEHTRQFALQYSYNCTDQPADKSTVDAASSIAKKRNAGVVAFLSFLVLDYLA
jgi:hypothetical protein